MKITDDGIVITEKDFARTIKREIIDKTPRYDLLPPKDKKAFALMVARLIRFDSNGKRIPPNPIELEQALEAFKNPSKTN